MNKAVAVVGLGYVGLPLALLSDSKGYQVSGIDKDKIKIKAINSRKSPFADKEIAEQLKKTNLQAFDNYAPVKKAQIIIVCVPTPVDNLNNPDLSLVIAACSQIAKNLTQNQLVIIESTINPGVCDEVVVPTLEKESGLKCGEDFNVAHCPERINPGDKKWHVGNIPRVLGAYDKNGLKQALDFYESIVDAPIKPMGSLQEAEAVKVVENSFRDINIAFVNELAMSFTTLGIDVVNVIDGAATKPFAFMPHYPGVGVGGHCIPVDPYYLIEYAKKKGFEHRFLSIARQINNSMPAFTLEQLREALNEHSKPLKNSKITILGLSYKPDVGDLRESPSLEVIDLLLKEGAKLTAYDPYVTIDKKNLISIKNAKLDEALKGADAVLLATAHSEFKTIKPNKLKKLGIKIVVDGRNFLDKDFFIRAGISYRGIGR